MKVIKTLNTHKNQRFIVKEDLVEHNNKLIRNYTYIDKNDACLVLIIYQNKIGLINTSRYIIKENESYELIGGRIENNETAKECVIRELKEETNLEVSQIQHFFDTYPLPSLTTEKVSIFIAEIDNKKNVILDDEELINELLFFTNEEIRVMIANNKIKSSVDCLAVLKYLFKKQKSE